MIRIIFESHATTHDNQAGLSSGHNDVDLSPRGVQEALQLGERHREDRLDAVYCSDLQRSYKTAILAFTGRSIPILPDRRLRECDYGSLSQQPAALVKAQRAGHVTVPFPGGESYRQTAERIRSFLADLAERHRPSQTVVIVGHRATQYGLEHWLKGVPLEAAVIAPWTWQPGWDYELKAALR
jgi:broad specificity phosphatase PhoE